MCSAHYMWRFKMTYYFTCFYCKSTSVFPMDHMTKSLVKNKLLRITSENNQNRFINYLLKNTDHPHICYACIHDISSMNEERINEMLFKLELGLV